MLTNEQIAKKWANEYLITEKTKIPKLFNRTTTTILSAIADATQQQAERIEEFRKSLVDGAAEYKRLHKEHEKDLPPQTARWWEGRAQMIQQCADDFNRYFPTPEDTEPRREPTREETAVKLLKTAVQYLPNSTCLLEIEDFLKAEGAAESPDLGGDDEGESDHVD